MKMRTLSRYISLLVAASLPALASAQERIQRPAGNAPAGPTVGPPIQQISTASALSTEPIGAISSVRELPDGRILVNDGVRRRLLVMDTTLATVEVALDSISSVANSYGTRAGALIPYRADSTLFVDPASYAVLVLDPAGKIARVRSVWRAQDVGFLSNPNFGVPRVDARGRVVYRIAATPAPPAVAPPPGVPYIPQQPDSAFIVAVDLDTRSVDTLGVIRVPATELRARRTSQGALTFESVINPLPSTDDWAILPDGRVAFVRGIDYRIEYLNPDGTITSSEKLPYDWQRMTDADKERMVDSVRTARQRVAATNYVGAMIRWVNMYRQKYPENLTVPEGFTLPPGLAREWTLPPGLSFPANYIYACAAGEEPTMTAGPAGTAGGPGTAAGAPPMVRMEGNNITIQGGPPAGAPGANMTMINPGAGAAIMQGAPPGVSSGTPSCIPGPVMLTGGTVPSPPTMASANVIDAEKLPDYRPPLPTGGVRADEDGNLWIRTIPVRPIPGGLVYDIVNSQGELTTRYQLPPGYTIVGFGKGKVVYLSMRDQSGIHLARVRLR